MKENESKTPCCLQIKDQTPELGKVTQVMKLSLDKAYDYALDPQLAEMRKGVTIRFMPDAQQVKHALEVSSDAIRSESRAFQLSVVLLPDLLGRN